MDANLPGRCACGAVRYTLAEPPVAVRICWCRECQYIAAGNGSVNLRVRRAAISMSGPLRGWETTAASGNTIRRSFCSECGTPVLSESSGSPDVVVIRAGTLDDPSQFPPQQHIWAASAPTWACLDDSLPATPRQP